MTAGHVGQLVLQIPWSNLKNKPVKVVIEDVFLLAAPKDDTEYDEEEEERRAQALKRDRLENLEMIEQAQPSELSQDDIKKNQSFTESLVTKVVDNLQVTIKNIHIRYEDHGSIPNHPFSVGIMLGELSAVSTDDDWNPIFIQETTPITKKLATLNSLAVYWNTDSKLLDAEDPELLAHLKGMIPTGADASTDDSHEYILRPVSGVGRLTLNKQGSTAYSPKTKAQLIFDDLGFVFDSDQYRDMLWAADLFRLYMKSKEYKKYRPKVSVKEDPRAWLKYAATVVKEKVHEKHVVWSWEFLKSRIDQRRQYIDLYKKLKTSTLTIEEQDEIHKLEWDLTYDDIKFYRALAKSELRKEKAKLKPPPGQQQQQGGGWMSWIWGSSAATPETTNKEGTEADVTMTEEQKQEFYEAIEWDEKQALMSSLDVPRNRVTMELSASLKTGSFRLKEDPHGKSQDITALLFNGFKASFYQRPDSFFATASLDELKVEDRTGTSLFDKMISMKAPSGDDQPEESETPDPLFWMSFENNPLDESADTSLNMRLKGLSIYYNVLFVERIARFFKPPRSHLETIGAIMNAAGATMEGITSQTRIGLEYALQEHKTMNVKMDIQAPLIILPLDVTTWGSPCAVIDAGHISVVSDLVGKEVLDQIKSKQSQHYTEQDWKKLESLMYDKFNLRMSDTQILIGANVRDTIKQLNDKSSKNHYYVIDRTNMNFLVENSILPQAQSLTRFKVSGHLPVFRASMSDAKYKIMMQLIDKCIPNFDFDSIEVDENPAKRLLESSAQGAPEFSLDEENNSPSSSQTLDKANRPEGGQTVFQFNFEVDKVELSLHRAKDAKTLTQEGLVDLTLEKFALDFRFLPTEMSADVNLKDLFIEDYTETQTPHELRQLVSSDSSNGGEGSDELFSVKYKRTKRDGNPDSEISDQEVYVSLSTLRFVLAPKSSMTILDFIITTFTNPENEQNQSPNDDKSLADSQLSGSPPAEDGHIHVHVDMRSIILVLNDEGIKLATLRLDSAVIGVKLVSETMKVESRIGSLTLHDDVNEGASRDSIMRQLVSIEGDNLMDLRYETFPKNTDMLYNSSFYLRSGSIKVNVVEEPLTRIFKFLFRINQLKDLYATARQAAMDQANQIEDPGKIQLDVLVRTPILVFPRPVQDETDACDTLTAQLGEFYLSNEFLELDVEGEQKPINNSISAGVRSTRLTSQLFFSGDVCQTLNIIDGLNLHFDMSYVAPYAGMKRPAFIVSGKLPEVKIDLTELQCQYLVDVSRAVPAIFAGDMGIEEEEMGKLESEVLQSRNIESLSESVTSSQVSLVNTKVDKVDFSFQSPSIVLGLYHNTVGSEDISNSGLSSFELKDFGVKFNMKHNSDWESDIHIHSFTVHDTRLIKDNKFVEIIPPVSHEESQFMCRVVNNAATGVMDTMLTVDTPRMILALEYLFALKAYADVALSSDQINGQTEVVAEEEEEEDDESEDLPAQNTSSGKIKFNFNIVDPSIILLANPTAEDSEAIVLKADQLVMSQREMTTISVSKVGVFLNRMGQVDSPRLRILDDFSLTATMDDRETDATHLMTKIQVAVEPLVLRLSMQDIVLALDILTKASALSQPDSEEDVTEETQRKYSKFANPSSVVKSKASASRKMSISHASGKYSNDTEEERTVADTIIYGEDLSADFEGLRLVLIGMHHELPVLDLCVKPFSAYARNWSSDLKVDVGTESFANVYNVAKSTWEPLIETWDLGFHISRSVENNQTLVNLVSRRVMEISLTHQTLNLISESLDYMQKKRSDGDFLTRPREDEAPYRILNETGYEIELWKDEEGPLDKLGQGSIVGEGKQIPWRFRGLTDVRENLSTDTKYDSLAVRLKDSPYEPVRKIAVTSEGEHLYLLYPRTEKVLHRLLCEIRLNDGIKEIVLRSALTVTNDTQSSLFIRLNNAPTEMEWQLKPGASRAIPIEYAYNHPIEVRPDNAFGFKWSSRYVFWRELLTDSVSLSCDPENPSNDSPFYYNVVGKFDKSTPLSRVYPHMSIVFSAPVEVCNNLPFDIAYRVYDKKTKRDWSNKLEKGKISPVHVVELSHLLLLSVQPEEGGFDNTNFAIINSNSSNFKREYDMTTRSKHGQRLRLKLHYSKSNSGTGYRVTVYCPYVILNKTGIDLQIRNKLNTATSKVSTHSAIADGDDSIKRAIPQMWSYDTDDRSNRALLKVGDSKWSDPQSFEAIGSNYEVMIPSSNRQNEIHVGVSIGEGPGKYKLTKVVTIAPRFVINNMLKEDLIFRDPNSQNVIEVKKGSLQPLHFLRQSGKKQLLTSFNSSSPIWSSPFNIEDIGRIHLKLYRNPDSGSSRYALLRIDTILEGATLYIHLQNAGNNWPYSIRNFTNYEFTFYQANPYVDEQGVEASEHPAFVPTKYKIPAKSVMPYTWDYPAATMKELVLEGNRKERRIQLAEIGNLPPMKIPTANGIRGGIVDLDVVADGPTQTLAISNYDSSKSMYKLKSDSTQASLATSSQTDFNVQEEEEQEHIPFNLNIRLEGVGVSLINKRVVELCYLTLRGFEFNYRSSELYDTFSVKMKWIQVDNQLYGGIYPIVLFPSVIPKSGRDLDNHPTFSGSVTRVKDDSHGVLFIKHATVLLQQMTCEVDEDFLFSLMDFARAFEKEEDEEDVQLCDEALDLPVPQQDASGLDVYFEMLHIQPAQMDLSFVRTERVNVEERPSSEHALTFFFNVLTMAIGNINDAPVKLNALIMENVRTPLLLLTQSIQTHYGQEFIYQVHKILGSADVIGNPVGLFNNISSGFMDIFYEPYQGYILHDRPQELGIGLAKGGLSFVKKSVFGVSDSISKITGSISKGLAVATMDESFQSKRRMKKSRNKPRHALYGLASGANSVVEGISSGVSGLALSPMQGAAKEGTAGFFKGLGKGIVGLPTKTAIGLFDMANSVSEGVRNTTTVFDGDAIDRVRLTRYIGRDGVVRPYSQREAVGQSWLKAANNGKYFDEEYLAHLNLGTEDKAVVVTFTRIMLLSTVRLVTEWEIEFHDLQTIAMERTGLALILRGGVQGPFIPISDVTSRRFLYKEIGVAVNDYNRTHQTQT